MSSFFSRLIIILSAIFFAFSAVARAEHPSTEKTEEAAPPPPSKKTVSFEHEFDAYYTNVGLYLSLTDEPIPDVGERDELLVYKDLLFSSYIPRFLVLEAAVFPMPDLGVLINSNMEDIYKSGEITESLNLVKAVTAGFEEPYAVSLFLGNVVSFTRQGEPWRSGNFGYMGYLVSYGDYHIKDNRLIEDDWLEFEWKIKGDRKFSTHDLHWSFRVGGKVHSNPDIKDVVYISVRRGRLDFEESSSILKNSGFEYTFDMDSETLKPIRHILTVDRRWAVKERRVGFTLAAGFIWESEDRYTGDLRYPPERENFQFIIRPNIIF